MNITKQLLEHLVPLLPEDWDVVPYSASLDVLERPAVLAQYLGWNLQTNGNGNPVGKSFEIALTYVSPITDVEAAEEDLWTAHQALEDALDQLPFVQCLEGQRGVYPQQDPTNEVLTLTLQIVTPY